MNRPTSLGVKGYRPDIDGLRAVAVLAVVFFHLNVSPFTGGFIGVDVFFVISGFLITRILCNEIDEGRFSIVRFYERRMRRIAPALFAVIFASLIAAYFIFMPQEAADLGKSIRYTLLMAANLYWWKSLDYFAAPLDTEPMLHMWSLAIEEQFYLFLPVVLLLVARFWARSRPIVLWVLLIVSFISCIFMMQKNTPTAFYWLPFRAWELLAGSVLIFLPTSNFLSSRMRNVIALFGISFLLAPIFLLDSASYFPGFNAVPAVLGSALLIWVGTGPKTLVASALSFKPVVYVGLISYSLYLWHWPMIVFARYWLEDNLTAVQIALLLCVMLFVSILSYRFIEKPFRQKEHFSATTIFRLTFGIGATFLALAILFSSTKGFPGRLPNDVKAYLSEINKVGTLAGKCTGVDLPLNINLMGQCHLGAQNETPTILLLGDSFAGAIAKGFDAFLKKHNQSGVIVATGGCLPIIGLGGWFRPTEEQCETIDENIIQLIGEWKIQTVVLHGRWSALDKPKSFKWIKAPKKDSFLETAEAAFSDTIKELQNRNINIVIIENAPEYEKNVPLMMARQQLNGKKPYVSIPLQTVMDSSKTAVRLFSPFRDIEGILFIDPKTVLCPDELCFAQNGGKPIYWDDAHLNSDGSVLIAPAYEPMVKFLGW